MIHVRIKGRVGPNRYACLEANSRARMPVNSRPMHADTQENNKSRGQPATVDPSKMTASVVSQVRVQEKGNMFRGKEVRI